MQIRHTRELLTPYGLQQRLCQWCCLSFELSLALLQELTLCWGQILGACWVWCQRPLQAGMQNESGKHAEPVNPTETP